MFFSDQVFIGIDPSGGRSPFTYAALDGSGNLLALGEGELDDVLAFLGGQPKATAAVNAPQRVNLGLVRKKLEKESLTPGHLRGADMRQAEYDLRRRGINIAGTPGRAELCPAWVQMGFILYRRLEGLGYKPNSTRRADRVFVETHPHAAFCALVGQPLLSKPSLEGRLQRQVALHQQGLGIKDPMEFFEEITRHKLLKGILPTGIIYAAEQLDALAAAYTAYCVGMHPEQVTAIGAEAEGRITLPVPAWKEHY
ncbi:MAG: DUF429 domain-containing protein [Chloroflexi bacterium]|nr:DUF429 domain-containing protein [Chloroflexota bacterium]